MEKNGWRNSRGDVAAEAKMDLAKNTNRSGRRSTLRGAAATKDTLMVAKKSLPPPRPPQTSGSPPQPSGSLPPTSGSAAVYSNYLAFLEDPKSATPFTVLPGNKIRDLQAKDQIDTSFLNNSRRKRQYDLAFTRLFDYPCRIFAKCESRVPLTILHDIISSLNCQFNLLLKCKVPVEEAYQQMMMDNNRKVVDGINYETGEATGHPLPIETASSYSEKSNNEDTADSNDRSKKEKHFMKKKART